LAKEEIVVENPDNNVAFMRFISIIFSDWIKIKPESFTLESEKIQKVILEIKNKEKGNFFN
jgi:hypothetical protein